MCLYIPGRNIHLEFISIICCIHASIHTSTFKDNKDSTFVHVKTYKAIIVVFLL